MFVNIILVLIGFVLLVKGADFLVDGASNLAKKFNIPQIVIGLTIVAIGTSMPELVVSLNSAMNGYSDLSLGNIIGSNLVNLLFILGICAIIKPLPFSKGSIKFEIPFSITITILLFFFCINGNSSSQYILSQPEGIFFIVLCILFILYNFKISKQSKELYENNLPTTIDEKNLTVLQSLAFILIGILGLKFGGDFVVNGSIEIATILGISEKLIGLTIVAIGTSLPELFTSVVATRKGETDIAIGNILGSQIFNILLILGISSIICPINYSISYNKDLILLIISSGLLALYPFIGMKNHMTRGNGILFVSIYVVYIITLIAFDA